MARGVHDDEQTLMDADEKLRVICHAENNAIMNAARIGVALQGAAIYVTKFPCLACCNAIIQAGVKKIYTPTTAFGMTTQWTKTIPARSASCTMLESRSMPRFIRRLNRLNKSWCQRGNLQGSPWRGQGILLKICSRTRNKRFEVAGGSPLENWGQTGRTPSHKAYE